MDVKHIKKHVYTLATLPENDTPLISCYVDTQRGLTAALNDMKLRYRRAEQAVTSAAARDELQHAYRQIERFVKNEMDRRCQGAAVFARAGSEPFFLGLQFYVPVPAAVIVDTIPNIYHLIEMKDTYHRYVIFLATNAGTRILTVNCGAISEQVWQEFPQARERIGREWTREHYRENVRERRRRVVKEQLAILEKLAVDEHYHHLILAGNSAQVAEIRRLLPKRLQAMVIDNVPLSGAQSLNDIVEATIPSFIREEDAESEQAVAQLRRRVRTDGLACAGFDECSRALDAAQADQLILAPDLVDDARREVLVRLATLADVSIELVKDRESMAEFDGVGCLLRYQLSEHWEPYSHATEACA